jgi:hypothetical protein
MSPQAEADQNIIIISSKSLWASSTFGKIVGYLYFLCLKQSQAVKDSLMAKP